MKKFNLKSGLCGFMAGIMVTAAVPVLAYNGSMNILATFKNIKIYIDGAELTPRDSAGNVLEPFIYNGSTYLPIRAVGEAVGKTVSYDANSNSVYLGNSSNSGATSYSNSQGIKLEPYQISEGCEAKNIELGGITYKNALQFGSIANYYDEVYAYYNLSGQYTSVNLVYGGIDNSGSTDDTATIKFYGDNILLKEANINYGELPKNLALNVTGVSQLTIEVDRDYENSWFLIGIGDTYFK
ncbi:MAG: copper amine oxidase N-terminal domain-containing protein [Eubacterium sp.]|nr:copper amine oxidase N-terminal domain-containing protein [Eubacterium sp.]